MQILHKGFTLLEKQRSKRTNSELFLVLSLVSISSLFIPFIVMLVGTRAAESFRVPGNFALSTLIVILSSWVIHKAKEYKSRDLFRKFSYALGVVLMLWLVFLFYQYFQTQQYQR